MRGSLVGGDTGFVAVSEVFELVGVYNAEGSVVGELRYAFRKLTGRAHCALCDITHSGWRRRSGLDDCFGQVPVPFRLVHLDQRSAEVAAATEGHTPCVVARTGSGWRILVDATELAECAGRPERLVAAIAAEMNRSRLGFA